MSALFAWLGIIFLGLILFLNSGSVRPNDPDDPDCLGDWPNADSCVDPDSLLPDPDTAAPGWIPVTVNGISGVIVAPDDVGDFGLGSRDGLTTWEPTLADVEAAEAALLVDQGDLTHFRQYAGIVEDGDRKIHINGFCKTFGTNWYRSPVIVMDGGECYFAASYNVDTGELEWFSFNGYA